VTGYVIRRTGQAVVVILGVTVLVFILQHLLPGNPARAVIGPRATPQQIALFDHQNGLDTPLWHQYWIFLDHLVHGNLGFSYKLNRPVDSVLTEELPRDLLLVGTSTLLALLVAIPVGVIQAVRRNTVVDHSATTVSFLLYSMPAYIPATLLIAVFALRVHWFPPQAPQEASVVGMIGHPRALVLPIITLTLVTYALFSRYTRSSAMDSLAQDYIRTAQAKGLSERPIVWRHVLRNSLIPVVTLIGLSIPAILTAGLVVEQFFNFPGIGLQYYTAATQDDYPVMLGITVLVAVAVVVGSLLADLMYAVLDPQVRYR
jgi:peptide/nickel transport system permease protein